MTRILWLHVGLSKCGSSALQDILYLLSLEDNEFSRRYFYPAIQFPKFHEQLYNHGCIVRMLLGEQSIQDDNFVKSWFDKTGQEFSVSAYQNSVMPTINKIKDSDRDVVLSAEIFGHLTRQEIENTVGYFEKMFDQINIIMVVRDPLRRMESAAQQDIKWGQTLNGFLHWHANFFTHSPDESISSKLLHDALSPKHPVYVIQQEVLQYDNTWTKHQMMPALFSILGLHDLRLNLKMSSNVSLSDECVRQLSAMNEKTPMARFNQWSNKGKRFSFNQQEINIIREKLNAEYDFLDTLGFIFPRIY